MRKSLLKTLGLLAILALPGLACAVGMGGINVTSALGRPLKAEIALVALDKVDISSITVRLASPAEFKSAGIDYPYAIPKLTFTVETRADGEPYVKLISTQPVNEPFISLLLELSWSSGKLLREYTFLLDPEGFVAEQPKAAEVQPVEPVAPLAAASAVAAEAAPLAAEPGTSLLPAPVLAAGALAAASAPEPAGVETAVPAAEAGALAAASAPAQPDVSPDMEAKDLAAEATAPAKAEPAKAEPAKAEPGAPAAEAAAEAITVKHGDTLTKIAAQAKPAEVSLERMVVALYHANNKEFDGKNMNRLRAGKILRMPESEDVSKVTQAAAVKEIHAHVADWHAYRQKLAAAQGQAAEQAPKQEAAGKITAAVADNVPVTKEPAKEVLKLSKGEAPGDKQVAAGSAGKQEKRIAKEDDAVAQEKQLQEEKKRSAELKKIDKAASKLVELKTQPVEAKPAPAVSASAPATASSAVAAAKPKVAVPVKTAEAPASLLDDLLDDPIQLGAAVAVLLGLGGLGFVVVRRNRNKVGKKKSELKKETKAEPVGSATGSWVAPTPPSPETGDFTHAAAAPAQPAAAAAAVDDVDPIGEAELFLNFGRDAQAEEVLKEALGKNPSNLPVKLKLLSIYANRKDSNSFSKYAREVQQTGDAAAWEQVVAMGRIVDPTNPTYGGSPGAQAATPSAVAEPEKSVDFDLGFGKPAVASAPAAKEFSMDFDVTGTHPGVAKDSGSQAAAGMVDVSGILPGEVARSAQETPMDFDVSGILSPEMIKSAQKAEMDFDISGAHKPEDIGKATPKVAMDFDVTGSGADIKTPEAAPALNFGDLVFEMPTSQPKAAEPAFKPAPAADEGMSFMIDFPMGDVAEAPAKKAETASKLDIDFADISLNLDAAAAPAGSDAKDEHWHEVATKLDLAKAYQEMGDAAGAREILDEVVRDGDVQQRETAEKLLQQLSA